MKFAAVRNRLLLAFVIILSCVGCDQATKQIAQNTLPIYHIFSYLGDTIRLQHVRNTGAAFSIGADLPANVRWWIFVVGQGVFLLFLFGYLFRHANQHHSQFYGFALILGGGLGNFLDRIFRDGAVVDFLNVGFGNVIRTAVFNVADMAITGGLILLIYGVFRGDNTEAEETSSDESSTASNGGDALKATQDDLPPPAGR